MYNSGDFIRSGQRFDAEDCGPRTVKYMDYISNDLGEKQWMSLFGALSTFSQQMTKEEAVRNNVSKEHSGRIPLPPSDPPSPPPSPTCDS